MNGIVSLVADRRPAIYWGIVITLGGASLVLALWPRHEVTGFRDPRQRLFVDVKRAVSGQKIRLDSDDDKYLLYAGIRSPFPREPLYEESRRRNGELVSEKEIRLRFGKQKRDRKGRLLAYVFAEDQFVNETLVREGLAYVRLTTANGRFAHRLLAAQADARKHRRGLWKVRKSSKESSYPADPKYGTFHRPSCEVAARIKPQRLITFHTASEAFDKGFAPCSKCNP